MEPGKDVVIFLACAGFIGWMVYSFVKAYKANPEDVIGQTFASIHIMQWIILFGVMTSAIQHGIFHDYTDYSESDENNNGALFLTSVFFGLLWFTHKKVKEMDAEKEKRRRAEWRE